MTTPPPPPQSLDEPVSLPPYTPARWPRRLGIAAALSWLASLLWVRLEIGGAEVFLLLFVLALAAALAGVIAGIVALFKRRVRVWAGMILSLVLLFGTFLFVGTNLAADANGGLPIHDISTDLADPPSFQAVRALRLDFANPLDRKTPENLAELQRAHYPDIETLRLDDHPGRVFEAAREAAAAEGIRIAAADPARGTIEGTAITPLMGFRDDIVIRIREDGDGALVDLRSVSRLGRSDLGANAARIRRLLHAIQAQIADQPGRR